LRHELLRIQSEVSPNYEVGSLDALFEFSQATLTGPQRLVEAATAEIRRATLEPVYGRNLHYGSIEDGSGTAQPFVLPWRLR